MNLPEKLELIKPYNGCRQGEQFDADQLIYQQALDRIKELETELINLTKCWREDADLIADLTRKLEEAIIDRDNSRWSNVQNHALFTSKLAEAEQTAKQFDEMYHAELTGRLEAEKTILELTDAMDKLNGEQGLASYLCLFCYAAKYDASGISHTSDCPLQNARIKHPSCPKKEVE